MHTPFASLRVTRLPGSGQSLGGMTQLGQIPHFAPAGAAGISTGSGAGKRLLDKRLRD
jgi:hypothetical protein